LPPHAIDVLAMLLAAAREPGDIREAAALR
jgi:hypothetical protein